MVYFNLAIIFCSVLNIVYLALALDINFPPSNNLIRLSKIVSICINLILVINYILSCDKNTILVFTWMFYLFYTVLYVLTVSILLNLKMKYTMVLTILALISSSIITIVSISYSLIGDIHILRSTTWWHWILVVSLSILLVMILTSIIMYKIVNDKEYTKPEIIALTRFYILAICISCYVSFNDTVAWVCVFIIIVVNTTVLGTILIVNDNYFSHKRPAKYNTLRYIVDSRKAIYTKYSSPTQKFYFD